MSEPPRTTRVKILQPQTRVSGAVGEFIDDGSKRRKRRRLYGIVLQATSRNRYMVSFDATPAPIVLEVVSNSLRVEHIAAALPPDVPIPSVANLPMHLQENTQEMIVEAVQDQEEEEHLPEFPPESEDADEEELGRSEESGGEPPNLQNLMPEPPNLQNLMPEPPNPQNPMHPNNENNNLHPEAAAEALDGDQNADAAAQPQDTDGRMPGQLPTQTETTTLDYANLKRLAKEKIRGLLDTEVTCKSGNNTMKWKVISDHEPESVLQDEVRTFGLINFNIKEYEQDEILCHLFLKLTFLKWKEKVDLFNAAYKKSGLKGRTFTRQEFLTGLGLLIAAAEFSQNGKELFRKGDQKDDNEKENWSSLVPHPGFDSYMSYSRFKEFRRFLPEIWVDQSMKETDPWYKFSTAIDEFNTIRRTLLRFSRWKVADESMSAWRPRTTALGGLPNISFVVRKPEPLGTEFKTSACPVTGVMTMMEIQRGKEGMKEKRYNRELGATTGCTLRLLEDSIPADEQDQAHGIRGDAWFGSVRTASEVGARGHEGVFQVKQYSALYPKDFISKALEDAPGGVSIVLDGMAPNGVPLIALGYRYR